MGRSTSALSRAGRPGLMKSFSVSTPNVAGMLDSENAILERIRDLELQISHQQDTISLQQTQISDFTTGKDTGYESQSNSDSAASSTGPSMANLSLSVSINGDIGDQENRQEFNGMGED